MEVTGDLSEMLRENRNKYLVINVLAKRARALNDGARPEVSMRAENPLDMTNVALAEMKLGKLRAEPSERAGQLVDIAGIVK